MAGRSGRAGVSRGQEGGKSTEGVDTACGESFLIIPVSVGFRLKMKHFSSQPTSYRYTLTSIPGNKITHYASF